MFRKTNLKFQSFFPSFPQTFFFFFLLQAFCFTTAAQGNLLITPKRVVFDGSKRSEDLNLANVGRDSATFVISFVHIRMKEDGSFERIATPDSGQLFAEPYLRIFPRTVTLAPNEAQTIKLQVRRTGDMQPGEYRSHLYFRAEPRQVPLGEKNPAKDSTLSVRLTPIFGISIPVIVRAGEPNTQVQIEDITLLTDSVPSVQMAFRRSGNMSVYGDLTINHISRQGKITKVGLAKGLSVYTPNTLRRFTLPLDKSVKVDYRSGKLQVVYTDQSSPLSKKPLILSEKEIPLRSTAAVN